MSKTNEREYKIIKSDLWYKVYRTRESDGIEEVEWLQKTTYTLNPNHAALFYHISDATSALIIAKVRWRKGIPITSIKKSGSEERREKTSWSEL